MTGLLPGPGSSPTRRVHIITFGCQMNVFDSRRMAQVLGSAGWEETSDPAMADVVLINTCSVRDKPERRVRTTLARLAPLKDMRPGMLLGVCGCVGQQHGKALLEQIPYLDLVIGPDNIRDLPSLVAGGERTARTARMPRATYEFLEVAPASERGSTAFLTVIKGCDKVCTFCIVPFVRGRQVSKPAGRVLSEVSALVASGVREVTLLGQNVNSYGRDLDEGVGFADLIERVDAVPGLARLRFVTSHPADADERMLSAFGRLERLAEYLHLPLQAGSDRVLARMRRGYRASDYLGRIETARRFCPDIALSTDVIVGFPGETRADFEDTLRVVRECRFDQMYSFKYSPRPGTAAARMPDDVPAAEKAARLAELQAEQASIETSRAMRFAGRVEEVLVEGPSSHAGTRKGMEMTGRTRTNRVVNFPPPDGAVVAPGAMVRVRIDEVLAHCLRGNVVDMKTGC